MSKPKTQFGSRRLLQAGDKVLYNGKVWQVIKDAEYSPKMGCYCIPIERNGKEALLVDEYYEPIGNKVIECNLIEVVIS